MEDMQEDGNGVHMEAISTMDPISMDMLGTEEVMLAVKHHMAMLHLVMLHWLHMAMLHRLYLMVMLHRCNSRVQEEDQLNLNHRYQRCSKRKNQARPRLMRVRQSKVKINPFAFDAINLVMASLNAHPNYCVKFAVILII
jgi:hypothetical protein